MNTYTREPDLDEMRDILRLAAPCFRCREDRCIHLAEDGAHVCRSLQFWNGQPIRRSTLARWRTQVNAGKSRPLLGIRLPAIRRRRPD